MDENDSMNPTEQPSPGRGHPAKRVIRTLLSGRFSYLFFSLIVLMLLYPFSQDPDNHWAVVIAEIVYAAVMFSVIRVVTRDRPILRGVVIGLIAISMTLHYLDLIRQHPWLQSFNTASDLVVYGLMTVVFSMYVLQSKRVTTDMVFGAVCAYLFIGFMWASLFALVEMAHPGSFASAHPVVGVPLTPTSTVSAQSITYFSYVTLATLGYGDIVPTTPPAQGMAAMEAVLGQLFLATLIARLVGLQIAQANAARSGA